jgi:hypothetical protein
MYEDTRIQIRRGSASEWSTKNPILASGEPGYEVDTRTFKIGNGTTAWLSLPAIGHDVSISGVANNDVLVYNSGTGYWENNNTVVFSQTDGITGASGINNIVKINQSDYDNLGSYDPNTIYFVV